ncbi:MAG: plasmid stabilization protein [Hyphomicrobiales bacterium]|nr:plasmid stabilization protein [Hyphomicrobiales bacterium]
MKQRLRIRAAENGRSMEEEAREILREAVDNASPPRDLAASIRKRVARLGGVDLEFPEREPMRDPVRFD